MRYAALLRAMREELSAAGYPDAGRDAAELLGAALRLPRAAFPPDREVTPAEETAARALTSRAVAGEPVAYLLGEWDFYGLTLTVTPAVLIPRPDTEILAREAIEAARGRAVRALDLCAGSGCVGLALAAQVPGARVVLGEWSEAALAVCRENIARTGLASRVTACRLDARSAPPAALGTFGLLVSNPPYIPRAVWETLDASVRAYEPRIALDGGLDGLDFYRDITRLWRAALVPGGRLLFETGHDQAEAVSRLLSESGFQSVRVVQDWHGADRVVTGVKSET